MNQESQAEETSVLRAVYGEENVIIVFTRVIIKVDSLSFEVEVPTDYPSHSCPVVLQAPLTSTKIEDLFVAGELVLFTWIEQVREYVRQQQQQLLSSPPAAPKCDVSKDILQASPPPMALSFKFSSGPPLVVNKSKFQAHYLPCTSKRMALEAICEISTLFQKATHNMWAYRLETGEADNDDDGEDGAGKRLASLLHSLKSSNALVIVSRWYGGINLGPARFKYIMQVARDVLTNTL